MESLFSLLQKNVLNRRAWATREQLLTAIVTWIEQAYHRRRRQAGLGRLTPIEFESTMNDDLALAAQPELPPVPTSDPDAPAGECGGARPLEPAGIEVRLPK